MTDKEQRELRIRTGLYIAQHGTPWLLGMYHKASVPPYQLSEQVSGLAVEHVPTSQTVFTRPHNCDVKIHDVEMAMDLLQLLRRAQVLDTLACIQNDRS